MAERGCFFIGVLSWKKMGIKEPIIV